MNTLGVAGVYHQFWTVGSEPSTAATIDDCQ